MVIEVTSSDEDTYTVYNYSDSDIDTAPRFKSFQIVLFM